MEKDTDTFLVVDQADLRLKLLVLKQVNRGWEPTHLQSADYQQLVKRTVPNPSNKK